MHGIHLERTNDVFVTDNLRRVACAALLITADMLLQCCCAMLCRRHLPLLFLRGLFGTAAIACSYAALLNLPLGDAGMPTAAHATCGHTTMQHAGTPQ